MRAATRTFACVLVSFLATCTQNDLTSPLGTAAKLAIARQPSASAASGVAFAQQPIIQLLDAEGNPVSGVGVVVTAAIAAGGGTLGGTLTATTNANGAATFFDLSIAGAPGDRTLNFFAPALAGAASSTITISVGTATRLAITAQPLASAASGVLLSQQPVLQLLDAAGNAVNQAGVGVTATIASGGGTLGGTTTVLTNADGVATFTDLSITGVIGNRLLNFSATSLIGVTSSTITLTPGAATQLTITTQPSASATSGVAFAQQPVLQLRDAEGNAVSDVGVVVMAAIATGGGTLGGTLTASTNASGVATFFNLSLTGAAGDRTLNFSATGLAGATSTTIAITVAAAQLTVTTQPSASAASSAVFAQQPVLQLRDAAGSAVSQAGVDVSVSIATGGGTLGGTLTATTNASGVATFTDLSITGVIGSRTLSFSATGLTGVTSNAVNITPGAATQLTITTQPSASAASGVAFALQPVLQLRDAAGNAVSQLGHTVTAVIATGGGTLNGATSAVTNASGVATFTNLSITGTIGDRTLSFDVPSLTGGTSGTITITPGAATRLTITTQPSATATSGVAFAQQPVVQLRDAAGNAVSQLGTVVTAAIATGGGTLGGTLTASTNVNGVATFTNLSLAGTPGDRTLNFSAPGLAGATSTTIALTSGTATRLALTTQPSASAGSGVAFAQQPVIQLLDAAGSAVSQAGVDVSVSIATGGGTLGGTLIATTNGSGVATFTDLSITGVIGNRTLSFSATGVTGVTSNAINIMPGAASQLTITTQPSGSAASGVAFAQQPVIQLRDAAGNAVSQLGHTVTAVIATGGGTLNGATNVVTNASGVATFTGLSITGTIGDRALSFDVPSLTGATSGTITLTPGAATRLTITTQPPASATSGVAFAQQPVLQLRDAAGNAVSQLGTVVTAAIATGGGTLGGTLTASTNASGVATFFNLSITGAGDRTLNFSATGLAGATSTTISVLP